MKEKIVKEWIYKAEEDYESAISLARKKKNPVPDAVCFHCQQCIEKYLKAYLSYHDVEPLEIHDLQVLRKLCAGIDKDFGTVSDGLDILNAYAVNFSDTPVKKLQSKEPVQVMRKLRDFIKEKLK